MSDTTVVDAGTVSSIGKMQDVQEDAVTSDEWNKRIGQMLQQARVGLGIPAYQCAAVIQTNRRRYAEVEKGKAQLYVVELLKLADYLQIPPEIVEQVVGEPAGRRLAKAVAAGKARSSRTEELSEQGEEADEFNFERFIGSLRTHLARAERTGETVEFEVRVGENQWHWSYVKRVPGTAMSLS